MTSLKWLLACAVVLYVGMVALLYVTQRSLLYLPDRLRTAPDVAGMPEAQEIELATADGERVIVWHVPPRDGMPVVLYLHGNGASLRWRDPTLPRPDRRRHRARRAQLSRLWRLERGAERGRSASPTPRPPMPSPSTATRRSGW